MKYVIIFFLVFISSCKDESKNIEINKRIAEINERLISYQTENESLKKDLEELRNDLSQYNTIESIKDSAYLTPGETGYSPIAFDLGFLTVSLADIKPYANGSKVSLQIGNTLSSTIQGLKGTFEWGPADKDGVPIKNATKRKKVEFTKNLIGGSFTTVSVILEGVPPTEFGFLRLKEFSHKGIVLKK